MAGVIRREERFNIKSRFCLQSQAYSAGSTAPSSPDQGNEVGKVPQASKRARSAPKGEKHVKCLEGMVGGTRFELVPPTVSSARKNAKPLNPMYFK
jgi:hypothetical protein